MVLNFVNGTGVQKEACRVVAHNFLNLPFDAIPLNLTIEFVKDPSPELHDEFGFAEWTYGSTTGTIRIADIAPDWPLPWRGVRFLQEVFAHEVGHIFFASLPTTVRQAVVEMFGASSDNESEINGKGDSWEDRITEGIAETFKDAFLPQRLRRFPNRTNKHIPISRYPEFRSHFRTETGGCSVPAANLDFFNDDDPFDKTWNHAGFDPADYLWVFDRGVKSYNGSSFGFWREPTEGFPNLFHWANVPISGESGDSRVWSQALQGRGAAWVRVPQEFTWIIDFGPAELLSWANLEAEGGSIIPNTREIGFTFGVEVTIGSSTIYEKFIRIRKRGSDAEPWEKQSPFQSADPTLPDPPAIYTDSFEVTEALIDGDGPCGQPFVFMEVAFTFNIGVNDSSLGALYRNGAGELVGGESLAPIEYYLSRIPTLQYANAGFTEAGGQIAVPGGDIIPTGARGGARQSRRLVSGGRSR